MMNGYAIYLANTLTSTDQITWSFELSAGTYNFNVIGLSVLTSGIASWYVDGAVIVASQDWYSGGLYNKLFTDTGIVIPTSGNHLLTFKQNGKNASSGGYEQIFSNIWFSPTTD